MSLLLLGSVIAFLAFPGLAHRWCRRLIPSTWARLSTVSLIVGLAGLEVSLILIGVPSALNLFHVPELVLACRRLFGFPAPGGGLVGWSALALASVLPIALTVAWRRSAASAAGMQVDAWLGDHSARGSVTVVMLPTDSVVAYSVARPTPQVVVSRGLSDQLDPGEVEAVVRHELSHLEHRHPSLLIAVNAIEQVLPVLRRSTRSLRHALERWADEDAAASGPRARAAVHDALERVAASLAVDPAVAAFANVETVGDRLDALAEPSVAAFSVPIASRGATAAVLALLGLWMVQAFEVVSIIGSCLK